MHRGRMAALVAAALALGACGGSPQGRGTLAEGWLTRNRDAKGPVEEPTYAWPEEEIHPLQLPGTNLVIDVHNSYFQEEIQEEERRVFQVASYASAEYLVDFDLYLIPKTEAESLADLTRALVASSRDGRDDTHVTEGIEAYTYLSEIAFDGLVYDTLTLVTEDEDAYVRVVFWLEGDQEETMAYARQMIASLRWLSAEDVDATVPMASAEVEAASDAAPESAVEGVADATVEEAPQEPPAGEADVPPEVAPVPDGATEAVAEATPETVAEAASDA